MENLAGSLEVASGVFHNVTWTFMFDTQRYTPLACWQVESDRFWILGNACKLGLENIRRLCNKNYVWYVDAYLILIVDDQPKRDSIELSYSIHAMGKANCKLFSWASKPKEFSPEQDHEHFDKNVNANTFLANIKVFAKDMLTLRCEIIFGENPPPLPECHLPNQLRMLMDEKYTDVTVVVGERQIRAHKVVLAAHSPVFDAMFRSDMQESSQNVIEIDDFDYEVVQEMMTYIYSDSSPKIENLVCSLLRAADKYELGRLKALCEQTLCDKVSVDTAVEYQALAVLYNAAQLQRIAAAFIADNIFNVQKTDDWQRMVQMFSLSYICQKDKQNVEHDDKEDRDLFKIKSI
ncbi:speckle-type POZ protein-like [Aedes albopictus]|uniref:BTB domain-containing protein n=1 Tax=Aedes albopictus TaxID=7160 RepID=A0ABM2A0Q3_AEDAL